MTTSRSSLLDGLQLLVALADEPDPGVTAEAAGAALGVPASQASSLLAALASGGFVVADPETARYQLGPTSARLADAFFPFAASPFEALRRVARPVVERTLAQTGVAVFLSVRSGHDLLYLDAVMPPAAVRMVGRPGDRDLLHATSQGKVLLAFLSPSRRSEVIQHLPLNRLTDRTITDRARLTAELEAVRSRGFALQEQEREAGIRAVAAPVLAPDGYPAAALCLAGAAARLSPQDLEGRLASAALAGAGEIARLWYPGGGLQ